LDACFSNRWLTTVLFETDELSNSITNSLRENKIETREIWQLLHLMKRFGAMKSYSNGVSEELFFKGLCLPSGLSLTESERNLII
jgi:dTDP-4-amino-4,6-dideoxygalactose transaminase